MVRNNFASVLEEQAELAPIAIQEGFNYHRAEPGYVMLTHWIPRDPCHLSAGPYILIGIGGFIINGLKEVLAVKEKYSCSYSGVWKRPTDYINKIILINLVSIASLSIQVVILKFAHLVSAIREVKEETGVSPM
ncbi:hypothetical protein MLD38_014315 [Melastoma candidum]|uniref:Uncharacterized protein n=1 Tax=Melastoma candidum TaxID=119954 RepID=A0ACB9RDJ9_9MYRT|nr:hypothetical protein MLD38_014315 [Melastoma candidum]